MEDDSIGNAQITASNHAGTAGGYAYSGRLNKEDAAWYTGMLDLNQWLQVDLEDDHIVYGVQTQGGCIFWTKKFKVDISTDGGTTWVSIDDADGDPEVRPFSVRMVI